MKREIQAVIGLSLALTGASVAGRVMHEEFGDISKIELRLSSKEAGIYVNTEKHRECHIATHSVRKIPHIWCDDAEIDFP